MQWKYNARRAPKAFNLNTEYPNSKIDDENET